MSTSLQAERAGSPSDHPIFADPQASRHGRPDLVGDVIDPGLEEAHEALSETLEEMDEQLDKELRRLAELRQIRLTDPGE